MDFAGRGTAVDIAQLRPLAKNMLFIANAGFTAEEADAAVASGAADAVAFGRPFITNPDFCDRAFAGKPMCHDYDFATFYNVPPGAGLDAGYNTYARAA